MAKEKKEKVVYYDDNSTIVDMSNVGTTVNPVFKENRKHQNDQAPRRVSTFKEKWNTYWSAVKMMFIPMLVFLLILSAIFIVLRLLAT